jgi:hypothetical protein
MERREFANFYHIPYSTLQRWEKRDEDPKNINICEQLSIIVTITHHQNAEFAVFTRLLRLSRQYIAP